LFGPHPFDNHPGQLLANISWVQAKYCGLSYVWLLDKPFEQSADHGYLSRTRAVRDIG
jgi:hypothetical protein